MYPMTQQMPLQEIERTLHEEVEQARMEWERSKNERTTEQYRRAINRFCDFILHHRVPKDVEEIRATAWPMVQAGSTPSAP